MRPLVFLKTVECKTNKQLLPIVNTTAPCFGHLLVGANTTNFVDDNIVFLVWVQQDSVSEELGISATWKVSHRRTEHMFQIIYPCQVISFLVCDQKGADRQHFGSDGMSDNECTGLSLCTVYAVCSHLYCACSLQPEVESIQMLKWYIRYAAESSRTLAKYRLLLPLSPWSSLCEIMWNRSSKMRGSQLWTLHS